MKKHTVSISNLSALLRPGFKILGLFSLLAGLISCSHSNLEPSEHEPTHEYTREVAAAPRATLLKKPVQKEPDPIDISIKEKISELTLEQKVGQLLIIGFGGKSLTKKSIELLEKIKPGGVILFSRNIESFNQLRKLTSSLQNSSNGYSSTPLLVMVDQEGGSVTRVKVGASLPSALALAQTRQPTFIRDYSMTMASILNHLGINMNLAPVMDISNPNSPSFIGSRSFGQSPDAVSQLASAFALGHWDAGVLPTAKHFPGHGNVKTDSHKETPTKNLSFLELTASDLSPFKSFAELNIPSAIMLGHVSFPKIDQSGYPAAFSRALNHGLLRDHLKYDGLAITDDLEMQGADKVGDMSERTIQAILAGNDMIMVAWSEKRQLKAYDTLLHAVKSGRISEETLDRSLARILKTKHLVSQKAKPYNNNEVEQLRSKLVGLSKDVTRLSFQSSLRHKSTMFPNFNSEIAVYSSNKNFFNLFQSHYSKRSRWVHLTKANVKSRILALNKMEPKGPFVFYVSGIGTSKWIDRLSSHHKKFAIVINTNQPGAIKNPDDYLKVVHLNSQSPESGAWLADYLNQVESLRRPSSEP